MQALKDKRTCTLVPEYISSRKETLTMSIGGVSSAIIQGGALSVQCAPISDILARYAGADQNSIDLWILDVEGHDMQVLKGTDLQQTNVSVMLIEDAWQQPHPRPLDIYMGQNNYTKSLLESNSWQLIPCT